MTTPWVEARDFDAAAARIERELLLAQAAAARAVQAEEKGWKARAWGQRVRISKAATPAAPAAASHDPYISTLGAAAQNRMSGRRMAWA
jgi:hypothetical protein